MTGITHQVVRADGPGWAYANLTGPLAVPTTYAAAGTLLTLAATAWRRPRAASRAPRRTADVARVAPKPAWPDDPPGP